MTAEQFWTSYNVVPHDPILGACWEWNRAIAVSKKTGDKRGRVYYDGKLWQVHVLAYGLTYGPIPEGHNCLHHCDVSICIRPDHLFTGTMQDNTNDMKRKGRARRCGVSLCGTMNGHARFTAEQVLAIQEANKVGQSQHSLARQYETSQAAIWYLINKHQGEGYVRSHHDN